jgi:predicted Zn-dependent protease with MMP-like domain
MGPPARHRPGPPGSGGSGFRQRCAVAQREVDRLLARLPEPLREKARTVVVSLERAPDPELIAEGWEPDLLGLFNGSEYADRHDGGYTLPPQIFLYVDNLWDYAEGDEALFREEVRRTYLHELGHYLGLDEDDLAARGLD